MNGSTFWAHRKKLHHDYQARAVGGCWRASFLCSLRLYISSDHLSLMFECIEEGRRAFDEKCLFRKERNNDAWSIKAKYSVTHGYRWNAISLVNRFEQALLNSLKQRIRHAISELKEKIGRRADLRDGLSMEQYKYVTYCFSYSTVCLIFVKTRKGTIQYIYTHYMYIERARERERARVQAREKEMYEH